VASSAQVKPVAASYSQIPAMAASPAF